MKGKRKRYQKPDSVKQLEAVAFRLKKQRHPDFPYPVKTKYRDDNTNGLTKCVIDWICLNGYQAERINSMGRQIKLKGKTKWIPGSTQKGTADISATIRGRSVKIEIKCEATKDRYQSRHQKQYQKNIESAGGIYLIVRNFTDFLKWYQNFVLNEF